MIAEAIASLKEHSGSSVPAIKKAVAAKHAKDLPANWEKVLSMSLKRLTASGKLLKVKASYKLGEALKKEPKKKAAAPKKKAAAGVKKAAAKPKKPKAAAGPKKPKSAAPKKPAGVKKPKSAAPKKKVATAPKK
jgi:histone H1/5